VTPVPTHGKDFLKKEILVPAGGGGVVETAAGCPAIS
jgi:hypothetical protein